MSRVCLFQSNLVLKRGRTDPPGYPVPRRYRAGRVPTHQPTQHARLRAGESDLEVDGAAASQRGAGQSRLSEL